MIEVRYLERDLEQQNKVNININAGSDAYYHQVGSSNVFVPDVAYQPGSWGYVGGSQLEMGDRPGTTSAIKGTKDDPLFQTQRQGNFSYRFDVQPGTYELTLCFADLQYFGQPLAYDLGASESMAIEQAEMDIRINGELIEKNFSPANIVGGCRNLTKTYVFENTGDSIVISFESDESSSFINGISLVTK